MQLSGGPLLLEEPTLKTTFVSCDSHSGLHMLRPAIHPLYALQEVCITCVSAYRLSWHRVSAFRCAPWSQSAYVSSKAVDVQGDVLVLGFQVEHGPFLPVVLTLVTGSLAKPAVLIVNVNLTPFTRACHDSRLSACRWLCKAFLLHAKTATLPPPSHRCSWSNSARFDFRR